LLNSKTFGNNQTKVIIYFSPTCHFCQAEAEELSKINNHYQNTQWIWIASEPLDQIKSLLISIIWINKLIYPGVTMMGQYLSETGNEHRSLLFSL
jgi:thiol-disulfide isomerase/thioredoxin